jgi:hypothetical protein
MMPVMHFMREISCHSRQKRMTARHLSSTNAKGSENATQTNETFMEFAASHSRLKSLRDFETLAEKKSIGK